MIIPEITDLKTAVELYCGALQKINYLEDENSDLKSQLDWYKRQVFGQKSEKIEHPPESDPIVLNLFEEPVKIPSLEDPQTETLSTNPIKKTSSNAKRARKEIPDTLPSEDIVIEPNADLLTCACCGKSMKEIGREESKSLEYVPAHFKVIKRIRPKFACSCGQGGVVIADTASRPIEKSIAESSCFHTWLLVNMLTIFHFIVCRRFLIDMILQYLVQ